MELQTIDIREAEEEDLEAMWAVFSAVAASDDALPFCSAVDQEAFCAQWFTPGQISCVAEEGPHLLGLYKVGANYLDPEANVAGASYLVRPDARGRGVGRAMVQDSIARAREAGYLAMQFDYVPSSNEPAVTLYEELGFTIVDTLPKAFCHRERGLVDAYVMHRFLQ